MHPLLQDFLYGKQLECWAANGHLTLFTAFSREQARMHRRSLRTVERTAHCGTVGARVKLVDCVG